MWHGTQMPASRIDLLRSQFDLVWSLFEYHLARLEPEDFLWEPTSYCWTVRRGADGNWVPDFAESEPDPVPVPTIAWVTWHIGWWWTATLDHARQRSPRKPTEIEWPGAGEPTITWLRGLRLEWLAVLEQLTESDLDATAPFPWQNAPDKTGAQMIGWVNSELMKNVAEIGQLRMMRAATDHIG